MPMIVITKGSMCCTDCGGFHFLGEGGIVTHPVGEMYTTFTRSSPEPCPNSGKRFSFPAAPPTEAIEEPRYDNFFTSRPLLREEEK